MEKRNPENLSASEKKDILKELESDHRDMRQGQREIRRRWIKTQGAVQGRQLYMDSAVTGAGALGLGWEEAGRSSDTQNVDEEFIIFNDLRRVYNTDMQRLTSYYLRPETVPENKSATMKQGARLGKIYLSDHIRRTGSEKMKATISRSLILRNISIIKVHFDPHAGRMVKKPKLKVFGMRLGTKYEPEGDVVWDFPNPKCVLLPRYCKRPEDADKIEEYHIESIESVYRKFGVVVKPETIEADYFDGMDDGLVSRDVEGGAGGKDLGNKVLLKEKIVMPCPQYPNGAVFTWTTETLIRSDILKDGNPYFSSQLIFNDETAYADSILWDLLPIQGYLNLGLSATARWLKMISLLRRWIPDSSDVKSEDLDNSTGMNGVYKGAKAPEWERVPDINESIFRTIEMARDFIASHGYSNELAKMRRSVSGNALGILQEMDDTIFRPALEQIQSMLSRAGSHTLLLASRYINTPRLIKMSSMQGWQIQEGFLGEMLKGNFHVDINLMAGMPSNKVLRLEYLKSLYKDGLLNKEQTQAYLEFPSDTQALEAVQKQFEIADKRIQDLLNFPENYKQEVDPESGEEIWVSKTGYYIFDNQALMMAKLQEAMQESYPHWNPWVQIAFLEHWNYAKEQMALEAQQAMMMQAQAEAGPMGGGGAGVFPGPLDKPGQGLGAMLEGALSGGAQIAGDQPSRSGIPQPMATGFTG
jgi:hypothetical protein